METKTKYTSKDVFDLRHQDIDRAFELAKELMNAAGHDAWNIRAYAWCLIDLIKRGVNTNQLEHLEEYCNELQALEIDNSKGTEEILLKQREFTIRMASPEYKGLQEIKALKDANKFVEAAKRAKALVKQFPDNLTVKRSYAWRLYTLLKQKISDKVVNFDHVVFYLDEIFSLGLSDETLLMRCVWRSILSFKDEEQPIKLYIYALQTDFNCFEYEDYKTSTYTDTDGKQREGSSLVSRILKKSLDGINKKVDEDSVIALCDIATSQLSKLHENTLFLKWNIAKALTMVNQLDRAQAIIIKLLYDKPYEFWLWKGLAETVEGDAKLALACYCKSILCQTDTYYNGKSRLGLIKQLIELEWFDIASSETRYLIEARQEKGHKIEDILNQYVKASWYMPDSKPVTDEFYIEHSVPALALLYKDFPWYEGIVGTTYTTEKGKATNIIVMKSNSEPPKEIHVKPSILRNISKEFGTPIRVKMKWTGYSRGDIFMIEQTDATKEFPHHIGIVNRVDTRRNHAYIVASGDVLLSYTVDESTPLQVMDVVSVSYSSAERKDGTVVNNVISCEKVRQSPPSSLVMDFENIVKVVTGGIAFTERTNVFIERQLVDDYKLVSGDVVAGTAIRSYDRSKNKWGWSAVEISSVDVEGYKKLPSYSKY